MPNARRSHVVAIILTFIAIGLPFYVSEFLGESRLLDSPYLRFLNHDFWYDKFGPSGPEQTRIDEFKLVTITRKVEPGTALGENRCTHRAFMAKLLAKVADRDPRLIVLDKWYNLMPAGACEPKNDGTVALKEAFQTVSAKVPMVIAVQSFSRYEVHQFCPDLDFDSLQPEEVVLADYDQTMNQGISPDRVRLGLAQVAESRKVPLSWMAYRDCEDVARHQPLMWPTLDTAAAALLDPNIMDARLKKLERQITLPYTKVLPEAKFESVSAISLLCDQADENVDWTACAKNEGNQAALESLRHKIVVIGEKGTDPHGTYRQANYIAALLDNRSMLFPAPQWVTYCASLAWLILLFWIFYGWKPLPELAVVVSALITFALGVIFSSVITKQFGIFANVVAPTILEIVGLYLARRIEIALDNGEEPAEA